MTKSTIILILSLIAISVSINDIAVPEVSEFFIHRTESTLIIGTAGGYRQQRSSHLILGIINCFKTGHGKPSLSQISMGDFQPNTNFPIAPCHQRSGLIGCQVSDRNHLSSLGSVLSKEVLSWEVLSRAIFSSKAISLQHFLRHLWHLWHPLIFSSSL